MSKVYLDTILSSATLTGNPFIVDRIKNEHGYYVRVWGYSKVWTNGMGWRGNHVETVSCINDSDSRNVFNRIVMKYHGTI